MKIEEIKDVFLEMLKEGEKISQIYHGKRVDEEMLKYATIGARNFLVKNSNFLKEKEPISHDQ